MPFPLKIREEALVACGRHCSICRRFVGSKIECHHITPESQGGENTLENCIPLCFDCHADVGSYNPEHPKGTKYQPSELKVHRDGWNQRVSKVVPAIFDEERRAVDRVLFERMRREFTEEEARNILLDQCWGAAINYERLRRVSEIEYFFEKVECEFLDPTCEGFRASFIGAFKKFCCNNDYIQIAPVADRDNLYRIPKEWAYSENASVRERFDSCMRNLNNLAKIAFERYVEMIREIRRLLIVP